MIELKRSKLKPKKGFNKILVEAIDDGLLTLGSSVRYAIYWYLEKNNSIRKNEIPKKLKEFIDGIHAIFGPGASVIEKLILEKLYEKLGLTFHEIPGYSFLDYIKELKGETANKLIKKN